MNDPMTKSQANLWGLVLAGGEGKRLATFVQQVRGDSLPKQYVNFTGKRSMIEHTFHRVERLIPRPRVMTVISERHLESAEVRRQLADRGRNTVIVQPANKDTGVGILLPLTYLHKRCPDATVAVFPSDHFILEEERFVDHVNLAARAVHHDPSRIVLLGMEAQWAETEYGYVVPTDISGHIDLCSCRKAAHFVEKPDLAQARSLVAAGALWNTMIMVFKVDTLLRNIQALYPEVASRFHELSAAIGTSAEGNKVKEIYRDLRPLNFSKDILEKIPTHFPSAVAVLPVLGVTWSDWGSPQRLLETKTSLAVRRTRATPVDGPSVAVRARPQVAVDAR